MNIKIIAITSVLISALHAAEPEFRQALWTQIQGLSKTDYDRTVKDFGGKLSDYEGWKPVIDQVFERLTEDSGYPAFALEYSIIKKDAFNALTYPGGQFIIYSGLLDAIDSWIVKKKNLSKGTDLFEEQRVYFMGAVLAHELGHYYNKHAYRSYLGKIEKSAPLDMDDEESRVLETDADISGILLLEKAGRNPDAMEELFLMMNEIRQESIEKGKNFNAYLSTHPSPHERIAKIKKDTGGIHDWASKMEYAFSDVQRGTNLEKALKKIESGLNKYPDNIDFLKAKAAALHKIWLASDSAENFRLKGVIDLPSFRDSMVFDKKAAAKAGKFIPGDKEKYSRAKAAYRNILEKAEDPWFHSNYSVLLVYSPSPEDEKAAVSQAESSFRSSVNIQTFNNLAFCHYMAVSRGKKDLALSLFRKAAVHLYPELKNAVTENSDEAENILNEFRKSVQKDSEETDGTILLNAALLDQKNGAKFAELYFAAHDNESEWAAHLAKLHKLSLPGKKQTGSVTVDGLHLKSSIRDVMALWKEPDWKYIEDDAEIWVYGRKRSKVYMRYGEVTEIHLNGKESPSVEGLKVGNEKSVVDRVLGRRPQIKNQYYIYEKNDKIGMTFEKRKVRRILLFE